MNDHTDLIVKALQQYRGDDLKRAQHAFRFFTQSQMKEEYGQSGQTPEEILKSYQEHVAAVDAAITWVQQRALLAARPNKPA